MLKQPVFVEIKFKYPAEQKLRVNQNVPKNGFSPYNRCFGKGVYNNETGNAFIIKNSNSTDAVVLLVNHIQAEKLEMNL